MAVIASYLKKYAIQLDIEVGSSHGYVQNIWIVPENFFCLRVLNNSSFLDDEKSLSSGKSGRSGNVIFCKRSMKRSDISRFAEVAIRPTKYILLGEELFVNNGKSYVF